MTLNSAMIVGGTVVCAVIYRVLRHRSLQHASRPSTDEIPVQREDCIARLAAIAGLVAIPAVGAIVVGYGTNMAMSAGGSVAGHLEIVMRSILYLPDVLGGVALARARTKWTALLAAPCLLIYFVPGLARNLGL